MVYYHKSYCRTNISFFLTRYLTPDWFESNDTKTYFLFLNDLLYSIIYIVKYFLIYSLVDHYI